jgi:hypothetical protein
MSERGEIAVVLILALFIEAFIDRITALKMAANGSAVGIRERTGGLRGYPGSGSRRCGESLRSGSIAETCGRTAGPRRRKEFGEVGSARPARSDRTVETDNQAVGLLRARPGPFTVFGRAEEEGDSFLRFAVVKIFRS